MAGRRGKGRNGRGNWKRRRTNVRTPYSNGIVPRQGGRRALGWDGGLGEGENLGSIPAALLKIPMGSDRADRELWDRRNCHEGVNKAHFILGHEVEIHNARQLSLHQFRFHDQTRRRCQLDPVAHVDSVIYSDKAPN